MIVQGDEFGRTQLGNNNAYCQDNELSWMGWTLTPTQRGLLEWTQRVVKLRREHPVFRRRRYFQGREIRGAEVKDVAWLQPDGGEMTDEAWSENDHAIGVYIAGEAPNLQDERGDPLRDDNMLILLNSRDEETRFVLPLQGRRRSRWRVELDSARPRERSSPVRGGNYTVAGRSIVVLSQAPVQELGRNI
jgi:glycogen operon protein